MSRKELEKGDIVSLDKQYTIESKLGDGATCIVYSASYKDSTGQERKVNIKECYPYGVEIIRDGTTLIWKYNKEKEACLESFVEDYKKLMCWPTTNKAVKSPFDIGEANNTKYVIMESNNDSVTFADDTTKNLVEILKTVKLLAYYVGIFHNNNYLHLDIKPENFLVYPRPSDHIVLFDLGTVTPIGDIKSGKCKGVSYSEHWAAPEQKQGKISKLCEATDIYAIGAVLFEKVMDSKVTVDDIGCFAEWEFKGELFENVNPKIKRLLTKIFKHTITASIKRRYQSTNELIRDLDEAIKIAESKVYLVGNNVCSNGYFVGREKELELIKDSFDSGKKAVFLHGFGGIGKTEIAKKYAELHKNDYDTILFIKYDNNSTLQDKLDDIEIENFDGTPEEKRKKLRSLLDEHTLVIVDNFDVERNKGKELIELFNTKARILVSTRTDFSGAFGNITEYAHAKIKELYESELEQVFLTNAKISSLSESERVILHKVFVCIEYHTYAVELLARQMESSAWSFETLLGKLKSGFESLENAETINMYKDNDFNDEDNSLNIMRAVFGIADLAEEHRQVLRNMTLLHFVKMTKEVYKELTNSENLNAFNYMVAKGYVQDEQGSYIIHSLMRELTELDLKPDGNNCWGVYNYLYNEVDEFNPFINITEGVSYFSEIEKANFIDRFLRERNLCAYEDIVLAEAWFSKLMLCEKDIMLNFAKKEEMLIEKMDKTLPEDSDVSVCLFGLMFLVDLYSFDDNTEKLQESFKKFLNCFDGNSNDNLYCKSVYSRIVKEIDSNDIPKEVVRVLSSLAPDWLSSLSWRKKGHYGIPLNDNDIAAVRLHYHERFVNKYINDKKSTYDEYEDIGFMDIILDIDDYCEYDPLTGIYDLSEVETLFDCSEAGKFYDLYFNDGIEEAENYLLEFYYFKRVEMIINLLYILLDKFEHRYYNKSYLNRDWENICSLIYLADEYFENAYLKNIPEHRILDVQYYLVMLKCIAYAVENSKDFFENISFFDPIEYNSDHNVYEFTPQMKYIIKMCFLLGKSEWITTYMYDNIRELWPKENSEDFFVEIGELYPLLCDLLKVAHKAVEETIGNEKSNLIFKNIVAWCNKWLEFITNKKYNLREEKEE